MKIKTCIVITTVTINCIGCSGPQLAMNTSKSIETSSMFLGPRYTQDGQGIDRSDMADKIDQYPAAQSYVSNSRALQVTSLILGAVGGALIGWPLGQWASGQHDLNWKLAAIGGGAAVVAIPLGILSDRSMDSAVEVHNDTLRASLRALEVRTWKPGDPAQSPTIPPNAFG